MREGEDRAAGVREKWLERAGLSGAAYEVETTSHRAPLINQLGPETVNRTQASGVPCHWHLGKSLLWSCGDSYKAYHSILSDCISCMYGTYHVQYISA